MVVDIVVIDVTRCVKIVVAALARNKMRVAIESGKEMKVKVLK